MLQGRFKGFYVKTNHGRIEDGSKVEDSILLHILRSPEDSERDPNSIR